MHSHMDLNINLCECLYLYTYECECIYQYTAMNVRMNVRTHVYIHIYANIVFYQKWCEQRKYRSEVFVLRISTEDLVVVLHASNDSRRQTKVRHAYLVWGLFLVQVSRPRPCNVLHVFVKAQRIAMYVCRVFISISMYMTIHVKMNIFMHVKAHLHIIVYIPTYICMHVEYRK